ncbi:PASTA domain-containing protein [Leucobacter sp. HNU]|uniref:PASTA domain-containing protein n=1 Tax=Leucobacter sp. HNU TaxID=3236805 RepID=UPI003A7FE555
MAAKFGAFSLALGIVAFMVGFVPIGGLLAGAGAIALGVLALRQGQAKGFSITGLILGSLGALTSLAMTIAFFGALANPDAVAEAQKTAAKEAAAAELKASEKAADEAAAKEARKVDAKKKAEAAAKKKAEAEAKKKAEAEAKKKAAEKAKVEVPKLAGLDGKAAEEKLDALGFKVEFDAGEKSVLVKSNWTVESSSPAAGERVKKGATITLKVKKVSAAPKPSTPGTTPADAEKAWLAGHGVTKPTDFLDMPGYENDLSNPLYAIQTGWGGSTSGFLEIKVQEPLTKASVKRLGINVLNFIGPKFRDIDGITFTDSTGHDFNFYRHEAPAADLAP